MVEGDAPTALMAGEGAMSSDIAGAAAAGDVAGTSGVGVADTAVVVAMESSLAVSGGDEESVDGEECLFPRAHELPVRPPRAIECNYTHWAALGKCPIG